MHQHATLEDTVYFWFGSNDTSGSGDDGASPLCDVREGGDTISDAPILSPTPALISHVNYPAGCYEVAVAATAANGFIAGKIYAVFCTLTVDSQNPTGFVGSFMLDPIIANVKEVSDDSVAADNLELQYDTTGLSGDTFPATQAQVGNIASGSAAINQIASAFVKAGAEPETNTYTATHELDGTYHIVEDDATSTEFYYEFNIGANGAPVSVQWRGYAQSNGDSYIIKAYNWSGTAWEQIGSIAAVNGTTQITEIWDLIAAHVGTSGDAGKVRIQVTSSDGTAFATDQILVSYAVVAQSVGYANGSIWVDTNGANTNTTDYIDGVADNPVSTWAAALTLATSLGLKRFTIINGSSITLSGNSDNYTLLGENWTLALNGQSIANANFNGASVTGIATGSGYEFHKCLLGDSTLADGFALKCGLAGDLTLSAVGTYYFDDCFSGVAGTATPSIDFGAAVANTNLNMRHYSGGIEIKNMGGAGTDKMSLEGHGQLVLNANCAGGTIAIRGHFTVTDNAGGAVTLSDDARYDIDQVGDAAWDEAKAGHVTAGSFGEEVQLHALSTEISALNDPTVAAIATAVWERTLEGALTAEQIARIILAGMAGKSTGGGTTAPKFRDNADAKNRIAATVDANGNRTAVTLDGS